MVRTVDYSARKKAVLSSVINRYIKNAVPVSSDDIAREFELSPATIRNIFASLEDEEYLTHPHTSAGRIPTDKGYRYYVDFLSAQLELMDEEKNLIIQQYETEIGHMEDLLEMTSEIASRITRYASIVSLLDWHDRFFYKGISFILDQPEFQDARRIRLLIKMIEERQRLLDIINRDFKEKVHIYIGEELKCIEINNCALAVASYSSKSKLSGRVALLGPARMEYNHIIPALEYISSVLNEVMDRF
jgi:heat-inducible transcriptional repressor